MHAVDTRRHSAFIQPQESSDDDLTGAPVAAVYESKAGGIVDVFVDLQEKAESELADLRKADGSTKHNFDMLVQSLNDSIKANSPQQQKRARLMLRVILLSPARIWRATVGTECTSVAADHGATVAVLRRGACCDCKGQADLGGNFKGCR